MNILYANSVGPQLQPVTVSTRSVYRDTQRTDMEKNSRSLENSFQLFFLCGML